MLQGTIIENSLQVAGIIKGLKVLRSWEEGDWKLHQVEADREQALGLGKYLADGPWYVHFWEPGKDDVLVVFKDKAYDINYSDKSTWKEAIQYGKSIGILEEQLDFLIG